MSLPVASWIYATRQCLLVYCYGLTTEIAEIAEHRRKKYIYSEDIREKALNVKKW